MERNSRHNLVANNYLERGHPVRLRSRFRRLQELIYTSRILMKRLFVFLLLLICAGVISAQSKVSLVDELSKTKKTLKIENDRLHGDGAQFLYNEARAAQFFLIGEDHGIADMPVFAAALIYDLQHFGYNNFATETGPLTAKYLEKMASQPQSQKAFADFNKQYPFGIPFYNWQEEALMAERIVSGAFNKHKTLWGLDQEFIASSPFHLKRLVDLAPNKKAKALANEYYLKANGEFSRMIAERNPSLAFLASAKKEDFDRLDAAFKTAVFEARTILTELRMSWEIYQKNFTRQNYESNLQRSRLMKRHFMNYYNEALRIRRSPPKILFKFGANHMRRGRNGTNVYDIGNFVAELAALNGSDSFHLFVLPISGTQNAYVPFLDNVADKKKKYEAGENFPMFDARPFADIAGDSRNWKLTEWTVVHLRPLRPLVHSRKFENLPRGIADLIWAYDAVLIMPKVRAASLFE